MITVVGCSFFFVALSACDVVPATNPFDPEAPPEQQAPASLRGVVVLDDVDAAVDLADELALLRIGLLDSEGRAVDRAGAALVVTPTIDGLNRATFVFDELDPGVVRLQVQNVDGRFSAPTLSSLTLAPGEDVDVGTLTFTARGAEGPGSISGTVTLEGGSGGERLVSLFKRGSDDVVTTTTNAAGAFRFSGLFAGDYAVSATLTGFTPDYRTDIPLNGAAGFAATFNSDGTGGDALTLFPVTAVLLPQLERTDGAFYTRAQTVSVAVLAFGGVTDMRLGAVACDLPAPDCANVDLDGDFVPYSAAAEQVLPDIEGRVGIAAQFEVRSPGGFVFISPPFLTSVIRDVTLPVVDRVFVDGGGSPLVVDADTVTVDVEAQDASGVAAIGQLVTAADAPAPTAAEVTFELVSTAPGAVRVRRVVGLPAVDGSYAVWTFVRDRAGNDSAPVALAVRRDGTPADALPILVDDVAPLEGRSVLVTVSFDDTAAVNLPTEVQVAVGNLPVDLISGRQPFDVDASYPLTTTAQDGETLLVQARLFDDVGNVVEVRTTTLVALRGTLAGIADVEQLGTARERAGTAIEARALDGSLLASTTTDAAGAWRLPALREGRVTLSARRAGHRSFSTAVAFLEADETFTVDTLLPLLRGTLVGRFRRGDLDTADGRHGDISVNARLVSQSRQALGRVTATGPDGDWVLDQVPATLVGESWEVSAAAQGYSGAVVDSLAVGDNAITVANATAADPTAAEAVLLQPISGDFVLCSPQDAASDCSALQFTNLSSVRIHLLDDDGVTRVRGAADGLPAEATLPLSTYDARNEIVVALPDRQGAIPVFLDIERDGAREVLGPVEVFRDTVRPQAPILVVARGTAARRAGFTNEGLVRATTTMAVGDADEAGRESPLVRAPTFFADAEPAAPLSAGVALCNDGVTCTVLLPALAGVVQERIHDLWSFACDAAGNCSATAGHAQIVFDRTPPSTLHGLTFSPTGDRLVSTGPNAFRLGRPAFSVAIAIGEAATATDDVVVDLDGNPVADADAFALSFVGAIDADEATDLPADGDGDGTVSVAGLPLLAGEGDYDIFAVFVDAAGNASAVEPNPFTFTVTLDETAPSARLVVADGAVITRSVTVAARLEDLSERGTIKFVSNAADCSSDVGYIASAAAPATFTLADADGSQLVVACLRDIVDNAAIATGFITLDRVAPTGSVELDGGAAFSADRSLVAAFSNVSADVARLKVVLRRSTATITNCALDAGYVAFTASAALSIGAAEASGSFVVDACFEDAAGNKCAVAATDVIFFDTTSPSATLVINDGAAFTTSSEVRVTLSAVDADQPGLVFSSMRFANNTPSFSGATESFAQSKAGLVVASPTVEGSKTVCVEVTDELARTATTCDDIVLDLTAPAGTLTVAAFATASPLSATLRSSDVNIASGAVAEGLDCATATFTAMTRNTDLTLAVSLADTTSEGSRTIVACFKDAAGQVARVERTVTFDPTNPALAQAVAPADGAVVRTRRPTFTWATVPGAVSFTLLVRSGVTTVLTQAALTGLSFTPVADLPQGSLDWIVVATKASSRTSVQTFVGAPRVTLDVTAPTAATAVTVAVDAARRLVTTPAPCSVAAPCINDNTPRLSFTVGTDAIDTALTHIVEVADCADPTFGSPVFSQVRSDGSAFDVGVPIADGTYAVRVRSLDDAGNSATSVPVQFIVDRTGPDAPSLLPVRNPVSSTLAGSIVIGWTPEGPSGSVAYRFQMTTEARTFASPIVDVILDGVLNTSRNVKADLETGAQVVHQVRIAAIDALGNQSPFAVAAFTNDTTAPCAAGATLTILGTDVSNGFTDSAAVVVEVNCQSAAGESGPSLMQLGCDGVAGGKPRVAFNGFSSCVLPGGDGTKTAAAVVIDAAGNETTAFTDTIVLDRRVPTTPVLSIDEEITNNPQFSFSILESSVDTNFLRHEFMDGVELTTFDDPRAIVAGSVVRLALVGERSYNVRVRGVDRAGNASPEAIATVILDLTPPTTPDIADNDAPVVVNDDTFTFFLQAPSTDIHFDRYEISTNNGPFVAAAGDGVFTVPLPQNTITTCAVRGNDRAGNVGDADIVTVIEDSRNPRPVALADLPAVTIGGPSQTFATPTFSSRGAYVDVHFARSEFDVSPGAIDANFDHFEVRAPGSPAFLNFVPLCATATPLCPTTVRTDVGVNVVGADHLIFAGATIVGFRIPVARGEVNAISVRSVDRAGNTSVETTVQTTEASIRRATNDALDELESSLFGDRLVTIDPATGIVSVREPGPDAGLGTTDDKITAIGTAINFASSVFVPTRQVITQAPDLVVHTADNGGVSGVVATTSGPDRTFALPADNVTFVVNDDALITGDESLPADQPSAWGSRIAFRRTVSGTDTDILVRDAGNNGRLGDSDDRLTVVADDPVFQRFPQLSGEHLAFFRCINANCNGASDPTLVVVHSGTDRRFGTGDDIIRALPQAVDIDPAFPPRLFTPGTTGRAACKNVVAWAGDSARKGIHVVSTGPDGLFDVDDTPVQVMNTKAQGSGNMRGFALHDNVVVAADGFAPPFLEVATGGRDGCLTRTADNLVFDSGVTSVGSHHAVHDGRIVTTVFSPTHDVVMLDLNVSRQLWTRNEGQSTFANFDADVDGVSLGGGGVYDLATRRMQTAFGGGIDDADLNRGTVLHGRRSVFISGSAPVFDDLRATERGIDGVWGTADDRTTVLTATHPLSLDSSVIMANSVTHGLDGDIAVWAGRKTDTSVVPVLRFAGLDGAFGIGDDDCEVELSTVEEPGYKFVRSSLRRQTFQHCSDFGCGNVVGAISVREVTNGDVCTGLASTVQLVPDGNAPDIDGARLVYLRNGVRVIDAGPDRRLTTAADNTDTLISLAGATVSQAPRISGDRVVWVDARTQTPRVIVADLADGSERVVAPTVPASTGVSIEGDLIVFGTEIAGESFLTDVAIAHLGLQPDLPADARNPAPTRQRCPDDDVFEENDSDLTATVMNSGASVNAIVCRGDDDRFRIDVPAVGCVVRAKARFIHVDGDVDMELLNPRGQEVAASRGSSNDESITFTASDVGDHVVRVFGVNGAENSYDVGVTVTCR